MKQPVYALTVYLLPLIFQFSSCRSVPLVEPPVPGSMFGTKLIVTADDFGAMAAIDRGITSGLDAGFINTVSAMVTYPRSRFALIALHHEYPVTPIGLHVSVTSGYPVSEPSRIPSILDEEGRFYTIDTLIPRVKEVNLDELRLEISAQIEFFKDIGIPLDHLSSQHNFLHLYTPFFQVLSEIAREEDVPLRSTIPLSQSSDPYKNSMTTVRGKELAGQLAGTSPFRSMSFRKYGTIEEMERNQDSMNDLRHPDYLIDGMWGTPTPENLLHLLSHLPEGTGELILHLGFFDPSEPVPYGIEEGYLVMRDFERACIDGDFALRWLKYLGIEQTTYSELSADKE